MKRYSSERKAAVLKKLLPPHSLSVAELSREEGISDVTLYTWRKQAITRGESVPNTPTKTTWSSEARLSVVIDTTTMGELELGQYCREKGLYPEQIKQWHQACLDGQTTATHRAKEVATQAKQDKKRIRELERELQRKEKALAEAAALLILRKKLSALWGDENGDN